MLNEKYPGLTGQASFQCDLRNLCRVSSRIVSEMSYALIISLGCLEDSLRPILTYPTFVYLLSQEILFYKELVQLLEDSAAILNQYAELVLLPCASTIEDRIWVFDFVFEFFDRGV